MGDTKGLIPFIIEDETPREERVPKENEHANGVTGIDTITLAATRYRLGSERIMSAALSKTGEPTRDEELRASGIVYQVGPHRLEYLTPDDESSPLHEHIALNRPVPYRIRSRRTRFDPPVEPVCA